MRFAAIVSLGLLVAPVLPARNHAKDPASGINFYSIEREIALGKQLSAELERQVKLTDDPILSEYVNRLAQTLVRNADTAIPVNVRIIDSGELNAFTLPGGHIYVTSAMLRLTESESELAFVLAHELGHVAARHATREATRDQLIQIGSIPLSVLGGWTGVALREASGPASRLGLLKGARDFELAADRLGLDCLDRAGYDPEAAIDMLERIEGADRKAKSRIGRLYGSHPLTASRIDHVQKHLSEIAGHREEYVVNTSEYEAMRFRSLSVTAH